MTENSQNFKNNFTDNSEQINQGINVTSPQTNNSKPGPNNNLVIASQALKNKKARTLKILGILCLISGIIYSLFLIYALSQHCQGGEEGAVCGLTVAANLFWATIVFGPICLVLFITCLVIKSKNHIESSELLICPLIGFLLPLTIIAISAITT